MTQYNVHIYREMRLFFAGIKADTPEAAADIARLKPTEDADDIEDCNGEDFTALVDVQGDEDYERSVTVDFEAERQRKAASDMLAALEGVIGYAENEAESLESLGDGPEAEAEAKLAWKAIDAARDAIVEARVADIPAPAEFDVHAHLACRHQIADIWSILDVQSVHPGLTDAQAWEVLQTVERHLDAETGINWDVLRDWAETLFGPAPDEAE